MHPVVQTTVWVENGSEILQAMNIIRLAHLWLAIRI
jgi:hypothetical protein